jgi:hypothetical protein
LAVGVEDIPCGLSDPLNHIATAPPSENTTLEEGTRVRHGLPSSKAAELGNAGLDVVTRLKMSFGGQYRSNEDAAT